MKEQPLPVFRPPFRSSRWPRRVAIALTTILFVGVALAAGFPSSVDAHAEFVRAPRGCSFTYILSRLQLIHGSRGEVVQRFRNVHPTHSAASVWEIRRLVASLYERKCNTFLPGWW